MKVTIVGTGNMAGGIGTRVLAGGNDLELASRNPPKARALASELEDIAQKDPSASVTKADVADVSGDIVVLAVPYEAVADVFEECGDKLSGKIIVDITNPVDFASFDRLVTPSDSSAAEEIANMLPPGAILVKAFNTTFAGTLASGEVDGHQLDVLIAGDDDHAKQLVAALVETSGLQPIDAGPLRRSQQLEHLGFLHMTLQETLGAGFGSAVKILW
jgi:8-hydroxy-5-deazaflavin:NADPH oxidoreductase